MMSLNSNSNIPKHSPPPPAPPNISVPAVPVVNTSDPSTPTTRTLPQFPLSNKLITSATPPKKKVDSKRRLLRSSLSAQSFKAAFGGSSGSNDIPPIPDTPLNSTVSGSPTVNTVTTTNTNTSAIPINPLSKIASPALRPVHSGASSTFSLPSPSGSLLNSSPVSLSRSNSSSKLVACPTSVPPVPPIPSLASVQTISASSLPNSISSPGIDAGLAISQNVSLNGSASTTGTCSPSNLVTTTTISTDVLVSSINAFGISNRNSPSSEISKVESNSSERQQSTDDYVVGKLDEDTEQNNQQSVVSDSSSIKNELRPDYSRSISANNLNVPAYSLNEKSSIESISTDSKRTDSLQHIWESLEPNLKSAMKNYKLLQLEPTPIQWISSNSSEWVLGTGIISTEGSLTLSKDNVQQLVVPDLRKVTIVGTPHKRYMEVIIPPTVLPNISRIILSATSENDFVQWLASLLLFSSLKPSGLQHKVLIVPRDDLPPRAHGPGNEALIVGHFEVFFPYFKNKVRRSSAATFNTKVTKANEKSSAFSKDGMWQPVVGILDKSGVVKLMHESDGALIQTIDMTKILSSRVRQIDNSVFECRRVVYVYCKDAIIDTQLESPNKSRESHLFFCRFETSNDYFGWFTALRSFTLHRLFSVSNKSSLMASSESTISSSLSVVSSNQSSSVPPDLNKVMRICRQINLRIIEGKVKDTGDKSSFDLSPFHDTYVEVQFENIVWARTFVCHGNNSPFWREDFVLNDFPVIGPTLKLVLKRRLAAAVSPGLDIALGSITLDEEMMRQCQDVEKWFPLVYTPEAQREYDFDLYLCLKIGYDETKVLAAEKYSKLDLLLCNVDNHLTSQISEATGDINRLSDIFLKIMLTNCQALKWLVSLIDHEVIKLNEMLRIQEADAANFPDFRKNVGNTLFRGNSLLTKAFERYMKLSGTDYLDKVVGVFTRKVVQNAVFLEIDPDRLAQLKYTPEQIEKTVNENQKKLTQYTKYLWNLIKNSVNDMPLVFKIIFKRLRVQLAQMLTKDEDQVVNNSVAGFLFLRFFCPAILNPKLFGLTRSHPTGNVQRSLTLITKMLQGFANRVRFGFKEPWMIPMNTFLDDHESELLDFYQAVTLGDEQDEGDDEFIEEECLCKNVNDGSVQNAIGCTLSNPHLIDKYENIAKLIEIWNESAKKIELKCEGCSCGRDTEEENSALVVSSNEDHEVLKEFAEQCKRITLDRDEVYQLLEQSENLNEINEEEIINSVELKFDATNGKVSLSKIRIANTSKTPSRRSRDKVQAPAETTTIPSNENVNEAETAPKRSSRWIRLAQVGMGRSK